MQEIERKNQVEEKRSDDHAHVDEVKRLKRLEPRCVCARDDVNLKTKEMRLCAQTMRAQWKSVEVVVRVRIVQCHAIIDVVIQVRVMQCHAIIVVVIGVRVMECHASMDVDIGVRVVLCHQAIDNSGFPTSCPNSHLVIKL